MRICLIGMSGVGKSFWAKRLTERGWTRHDCDGEIAERLSTLVVPQEGEEPVHALGRWMGMPWSDGYPSREARYLALEEDVTGAALERASREPGAHVIDATGSVIYLSSELRARLRDGCRVVYLRTSHDRRAAMLARYLEEPKPVVWAGAFHGEPSDLARRYEELLALRDLRYAELAHVTLDDLEADDPGIEGFLARVFSRAVSG